MFSPIKHELEHDKIGLEDYIRDIVKQYTPRTGGSSSPSASTFLRLTDTPSSYTDQANKFVRVKSDGTGLEFITSSTESSWGGITGTLSNQTDLQDALNLKANASDLANYYTKTDSDLRYLQTETDPVFNSWLTTTPPLYPGGWYDAVQNTIALSGFNNDLSYEVPLTFSTGLTRTGDTITCDITQYTDALAVSAIKADSAWKSTNWDTAYGWGDHAGLYLKIDGTTPLTGSWDVGKFEVYNAYHQNPDEIVSGSTKTIYANNSMRISEILNIEGTINIIGTLEIT